MKEVKTGSAVHCAQNQTALESVRWLFNIGDTEFWEVSLKDALNIEEWADLTEFVYNFT